MRPTLILLDVKLGFRAYTIAGVKPNDAPPKDYNICYLCKVSCSSYNVKSEVVAT